MDYFLLIISLICLLAGVAGCLLPVLPGPPLCFIALILIHFTRFANYNLELFFVLGLITVIVQVLDYIVPVWGTKKFGGTKSGAWGSMIGLIAGLFFLPAFGPFGLFTIIGGPFLGAYLGEKIAGQDSEKALRAAWGSFIGFLAGTFMKLFVAVVISYFYFKELIYNIFK